MLLSKRVIVRFLFAFFVKLTCQEVFIVGMFVIIFWRFILEESDRIWTFSEVMDCSLPKPVGTILLIFSGSDSSGEDRGKTE